MNTLSSGSWPSELSAQRVARAGVRLGEARRDGASTFWVERRPDEGGRSVVVERTADGALSDRVPASANVRSRVHEYGGGSYTSSRETVYWVDFADQSLHASSREGTRRVAHAEGVALADLEIDAARERLFCIAEAHRDDREPEAQIVTVDLATGALEPVVRGHDFFSSPRLSADGSKLAFLTWEHPRMPWDGTELWIASLESSGAVGTPRKVAGGPSEAIFQPTWSPDGTLYWSSDRSGFWNVERLTGENVEPVCPQRADCGLPHWVFRMSTFAPLAGDVVISAFQEDGLWSLGLVEGGTLRRIDSGLTWIDSVHADGDRAVFLGATPTRPTAVFELDVATGRLEALQEGAAEEMEVAVGEPFSFDTSEGDRAHAFFYPPTGAAELPVGERPVALVKSHGGPTAATNNAYDPATQYWTSRGIAVIDVNYRGSTGYGREYRDKLRGQWGIYDVADCEAAARHLASEGLVDAGRLAIRGGSAGGFTTLCALTFGDAFKAGASHYGVGDLETLARDTHKFESRYLDSIVGPYPEQQELYRSRSPIHFVDRLSCPAIFFQGTEDKIVPPNQAEAMVDALEAKGLPVAYVLFEGEGHGFRQADNIVRGLEAELYFYSRVFGFETAERLAPVPLRNLDG
ncbi:MAG: S9 family peptidase [Acidobacteriota bacterium]